MSTLRVGRKAFGMGVLLVGFFSGSCVMAGENQAASAGDKGKSTLTSPLAESSSRPKSKVNAPARVSNPPATSASPDVQVDVETYRIGIEDELRVSVWQEPELSLAVVVRPDGMITLPLVNDVYVVGLKTTELQLLLTEKFKPFVNEPQVTVIVQGIHSRKVYLVGQVARQGAFALNGRKMVMEILAEAGGLAPFAKANSIYVLRNVGGKQARIPFSYKKAIAGGSEKENFLLMPGDIIVVP